jgi:hypothetical protein
MQMIKSPDQTIDAFERSQFQYTNTELNDSNFIRDVRNRFYRLSAARHRIEKDLPIIKKEEELTPSQKLQKLLDSNLHSI